MTRSRNNYKKMAKPSCVPNMVGVEVVKSAGVRFDGPNSPIVNFYAHIAEELGLTLRDIHVTLIGVTPNTCLELNKAIIARLRQDKTPTYRINTAFRTIDLQYGPRVIPVSDTVEDGKAYLLRRISG
jgi:hypothetical protein